MKLLLLVGAFVLVTHPGHADSEFRGVDAYPDLLKQCQDSNPLFDTLEDCVRFQAVIPPPRDLWTDICLGEEDMRDDYRRQKEKYCGCMHQTIFYDQPEKSFKSAVQLCKGKFPPLE